MTSLDLQVFGKFIKTGKMKAESWPYWTEQLTAMYYNVYLIPIFSSVKIPFYAEFI